MPTVAEAFVTLRPDTSRFAAEMRRSINAGGIARDIARIAAVVGAAATGGLLAIVNPARAVEQQLDILQQVTRANSEEMQRMSELARTLGADLSLPATSSKDAAIAMTELAKGGIEVNDVLTATKGVLQLTAAGTLDTGRAAEITANALNNFGLAGSNATRVADLLAAAANSASGEVGDMAEALEAVGALAKQAGVPIEDVVTSIALMAKNGTIGAEAGYQLRNMFIQLNSVTPEARKLMEAVGFEAFDAAGNMKPLRDLIIDLTRATANLTREARAGFLDKVFGTRASIAVLNLLDAGVEGFNDMASAVTAAGAAADAAAARNRGLTGAIDGLKSAVETLAIDLGTKAIPKLTELVRGAAGGINMLGELGGSARAMAAGIIVSFDQAGAAVANFSAIVRENQTLFAVAAVAAGAAIAIALGPGSIAVGAIAFLTAALVGFNTKWEEVFAGLPVPVLQALNDIATGFEGFIEVFRITTNAVITGFNLILKAANATAKAVHIAMGGMMLSTGNFKEAAAAFQRASEVAQFPTLETLPGDLTSQLRKALDDAIFAARASAAANQTFHGRTREQLLGTDQITLEQNAAAAQAALDAAIAAATKAAGGATITLDDLTGALADGEDGARKVAEAVDEMAERMIAAARRVEEQQTSDVVEAFFDAIIKGTDPDAAIARVRAQQMVEDQEWERIAALLREKLRIPVTDEFRAMFEEMMDATKEGGRDVFNEWRDILEQRVRSVGRLLPAGVEPRVGPTTNTYNINVNVPVDASGRVNTRELTDAIVNATVEARTRDALAAHR